MSFDSDKARERQRVSKWEGGAYEEKFCGWSGLAMED